MALGPIAPRAMRGPSTPRPAARSNASSRRSRSTGPNKSRPRRSDSCKHSSIASPASTTPLARIYHTARPHKSLRRRTPLEVYEEAREKAGSIGPCIVASGQRIHHDRIDRGGEVTLRSKGKLLHIGVGRPYAGWPVVMLVAGLDVQILGLDGSPLRHLTLDPDVGYQRMP